MTYHDLMRQWLSAGIAVEHARYRLTQPDAPIPPPVVCRHRRPIAGTGCFHCDRFGRKAPAELCADCPEIMT